MAGNDLIENNPLLGIDIDRLQEEMDDYQLWLDERADDAYRIAEKARSLNLDHKPFVEIPRASDLASRTEKLLVQYLGEYEVADDIRAMLKEHDRETTSIMMGQSVARGFRDQGYDLVTAIDAGLRVGLAILTEAVLVAPLEGISEVRLLNNVDGSQFVSVHFAGPIRAAGGTAQALAVLIADMIRRELNIGRYQPTDPEVERVKEEFGLYRGNLQYRPTPEEIDEILPTSDSNWSKVLNSLLDKVKTLIQENLAKEENSTLAKALTNIESEILETESIQDFILKYGKLSSICWKLPRQSEISDSDFIQEKLSSIFNKIVFIMQADLNSILEKIEYSWLKSWLQASIDEMCLNEPFTDVTQVVQCLDQTLILLNSANYAILCLENTTKWQENLSKIKEDLNQNQSQDQVQVQVQ